MRDLSTTLALAIAVAGTSGCGGSDPPPDLDSYFQAQQYANAACNVVDQRLAGQRQMRLYTNGGVALLPVTQGLASYYRRHSLSFSAAMQPQGTTMAYALDTDQASLNRALASQFPGVDLSDEAALMASDPALYNQIVTYVANFLLRPMVDFASSHSDLGATVTNLIVVGQLERSGGAMISDPGTSLAGLAISPALLAEFSRTMSNDAQIWQGVTLPANFTPMMVLGNNVLTRGRAVDPVLDDLIAAHEFGHTGALVHTMVPRNLMYPSVTPGIDDCTDSLDDEQLTIMSVSYGLGPAAAATALLAKGAAAIPSAGPARPLSAVFAPARLRALLAGDPVAMRAFVELLFHPGSASSSQSAPAAR